MGIIKVRFDTLKYLLTNSQYSECENFEKSTYRMCGNLKNLTQALRGLAPYPLPSNREVCRRTVCPRHLHAEKRTLRPAGQTAQIKFNISTKRQIIGGREWLGSLNRADEVDPLVVPTRLRSVGLGVAEGFHLPQVGPGDGVRVGTGTDGYLFAIKGKLRFTSRNLSENPLEITKGEDNRGKPTYNLHPAMIQSCRKFSGLRSKVP